MSDEITMTARRPYLVRAVFEWILDNELTPHLVVDADYPDCQVPWQFVQDGQIILNIAPSAVSNFTMDNDSVAFNARFSGKPHRVIVPMGAVMALYARENGAGSIFEPEASYDQTAAEAAAKAEAKQSQADDNKPAGSHLRVIK